MKRRTMYMHTRDGKPASYYDMHGIQALAFASNGHRTRAAKLAASKAQIDREQQSALRSEWESWNAMKPEYRGERPTIARYGYVLVEVPNG